MMSRAFSARAQLGCDDPKALPWAGMNQAFGLEDTEASNSNEQGVFFRDSDSIFC